MRKFASSNRLYTIPYNTTNVRANKPSIGNGSSHKDTSAATQRMKKNEARKRDGRNL